MSTRIVITDCDHDSLEPEHQVAARYGLDLSATQSTNSADVIANAQGAGGIVVQYAPITAEVLQALPDLRAIGRYGVGVDTVDVDAATAAGVAVCNVPDYGTEAVSDHAIGLALAVGRGIVRLDRGIRSGSADFVPVKPLRQISGRTFGIVGLGLIGAATARKARGLGYEVIASDVRYTAGETVDGVPTMSLPELLSRSDVVSIHTPLTAQSAHLIAATELSQMKPGSVLVNTSRGGVIDTEALVDALRSGHLYGAGLDVHEQEPIPSDHPLTQFENVALTPHIAWYTEESYYELKSRVVENVARILTGGAPRNVVNPEALG